MNAALRRELGAYLRASRALVAPQDVGLPAGTRRRAPGLRREEVAVLAGVSVAWYTWLEQGRVDVSRQVVDAVCGALRLAPDARRHAFALAGFHPDPARTVPEPAAVGPATLRLIESWPATPALAVDDRFDILAANDAYRRMWGDPGEIPRTHRNALLHLAAAPAGTHRVADPEPLLRGLYEQFRGTVAHLPDDARAAEIVGLLHELRPSDAPRWQCRAVADFPPTTVEVTARESGEVVVRLTFALLRPLGDPGVLLLTQTPGACPDDGPVSS